LLHAMPFFFSLFVGFFAYPSIEMYSKYISTVFKIKLYF
jgi:hypothetical protein